MFLLFSRMFSRGVCLSELSRFSYTCVIDVLGVLGPGLICPNTWKSGWLLDLNSQLVAVESNGSRQMVVHFQPQIPFRVICICHAGYNYVMNFIIPHDGAQLEGGQRFFLRPSAPFYGCAETQISALMYVKFSVSLKASWSHQTSFSHQCIILKPDPCRILQHVDQCRWLCWNKQHLDT